MLEYFGYKGNLEIQRNTLKKIIETNFSEYQNKLWYPYTNTEYLEFYNDNKENISRYPSVSTANNTTTKHLLIMPNLFKEIALYQTDPSSKICRYYIDMMDISSLFAKFQNTQQVYLINDQLGILHKELDFKLNSKCFI
jgi:rRNA maturation protein Rpf1